LMPLGMVVTTPSLLPEREKRGKKWEHEVNSQCVFYSSRLMVLHTL
jgi:hypothetical protein